MTRTDILKAKATAAPTFDSNGFFGSYHPNKPETKVNSLYWGLQTWERYVLIDFRQLGTEVPKCARFFEAGPCDLPDRSHACHDGEVMHVG